MSDRLEKSRSRALTINDENNNSNSNLNISNNNNNTNSNNKPTCYTNLFVGHLLPSIDNAALLKIFTNMNARSATVMLDTRTGRSKGFGFVTFSNEQDGRRAVKELNGALIESHNETSNIAVFPSKFDAEQVVEVSPLLYVRNIPCEVPQKEVEVILNRFGHVAFCAMREDPDGKGLWVILCEYDCQKCADNALLRLHHSTTLFPQSPIPVLAKYAKKLKTSRNNRSRARHGPCQFVPPPLVAEEPPAEAEPLHDAPIVRIVPVSQQIILSSSSDNLAQERKNEPPTRYDAPRRNSISLSGLGSGSDNNNINNINNNNSTNTSNNNSAVSSSNNIFTHTNAKPVGRRYRLNPYSAVGYYTVMA